MKAKEKQLIRERSYFSYLLTSLSSMFKWGYPESLPDTTPRFLEEYLHISGGFGCTVTKNEKDMPLIAECPSRTGQLDQFGDGNTIEGVTRNGESISGEVDKDIVMCYNNSDRIPDLDLIRYADGFSQVDKAIMANVRWTILAPVLCTKDDRTTKAIERLVDDMLDGKLKCITSEDVLDALSGGRGDGVYSVDITHPERIKNVQYQSELYDVLFRRFFNKYGLNIQNTSKHAQATTDEVHGLDSVAWVLALNMLNERERFCEKMNELTGREEWSVEFNEPWKSEYERFMIRQEQDEQSLETGSQEGDETNGKGQESVGTD